jgi:hypothetical protein
MKRLLLLTFILCVTIIVLSLVTVVFGRAQPVPVIAEGLDWCEDKACYMGIVPGQTSWREATTVLAAKPGTFPANEIYTKADLSPRIVLWHAAERQITITIHFSALAQPTLGSLILFSGSPCRVRYRYQIYWLDYPYMTLATYMRPTGSPGSAAFDPYWPVSHMQIMSTEQGCKDADAKPWVGFASLRAYDPTQR